MAVGAKPGRRPVVTAALQEKLKSTADSSHRKRVKTLKYSQESMVAAIHMMKSDPLATTRGTSKLFKVPRTTLRDRLAGRVAVDAKPGRRPVLTAALEEKLIDYACNRASLGIGFGKKQFMQYAGNLVKKHNVAFKKTLPSNRWWHLIQKRHRNKLSLSQPEGTASIRHQCMDSVKVSKYFSALGEVLTENDLHTKPRCLWNMDETGLQLDVKPRKVVA